MGSRQAKARSLVFIQIANEKLLKGFCMVMICRKDWKPSRVNVQKLVGAQQDLRVAVVVVKGGRVQKDLRNSHKSSPP